MGFNFIYLSEILNKKIFDTKNNKIIGYLHDIIVDIRTPYSNVKSIIIRNFLNNKKYIIPFKSINLSNSKKIILKNHSSYCNFNKDDLGNNEILLKEIFFDKQIIDISGSKVVRVNDIHLINEDNTMWVVHMDIGFKGFLRRLGWLNFLNSFIKFFLGYEFKDKLISWKYVQPISLNEEEQKTLLLKISQKSLESLHPADIAEILVDLGLEERLNLFKSLDIETASNTLESLPLKNAVQILESIDIKKAIKMIKEINIDRAVDLIINCHTDKRNMILKNISKVKAKQIRELSSHSEKIAGSIMNTEFISLNPEHKIFEALKVVIKKSTDIDAIHHMYVVNDENKLVGIVSLRELLISKSNSYIKDIMKKEIINVNIDTSINEVAYIFLKYGLSLIPVVDEEEKIVGVISMLNALFQAYPNLKEDIEGTA